MEFLKFFIFCFVFFGSSFFANSFTLKSVFSSDSQVLANKDLVFNWKEEKAQLRILEENIGGRDFKKYELKSSISLRDNIPQGGKLLVEEKSDSLVLRSGHRFMDALFALALQEVEALKPANDMISDFQYNHGKGIPCKCFVAGRLWPFVWTRDVAYSIHLSLGLLNPLVSWNTLKFKTSVFREGPSRGIEIVQDTGSGGSWPISTDRLSWALGAQQVYESLTGEERKKMAAELFQILSSSIESDRKAAFDPYDGLYRGETSFLDWREQTYPSWTAEDTVFIGSSKALSTNLLHYAALRFASQLARDLAVWNLGVQDTAVRDTAGRALEARVSVARSSAAYGKYPYQEWADQLKNKINQEFWLKDQGLYSAVKWFDLHPLALKKYDLLGLSLAIIMGVADSSKAEKIVNNYPQTEAGASVVWPQLPKTPIYHNRAMWPFVTAYFMQAAAKAKNEMVFSHNFNTMIRGAAFNLSNMENFEFLRQKAYVEDGKYSGPVMNSQYQLWSVAGFLSSLIKGIFGLEVTKEGLRIDPFITFQVKNTYFSESQKITLKGLLIANKRVEVQILFPEDTFSEGNLSKNSLSGDVLSNRAVLNNENSNSAVSNSETGFYKVKAVYLVGINGKKDFVNQWLSFSDLKEKENNLISVEMVRDSSISNPSKNQNDSNRNNKQNVNSMNLISVKNPESLTKEEYEKIFAPPEPENFSIRWSSQSVLKNQKMSLQFEHSEADKVVFNIYKNGKLLVENLNFASKKSQTGLAQASKNSFSWLDEKTDENQRNCYTIEAVYLSSGLVSHPTRTLCEIGKATDQIDLKVFNGDLYSLDNAILSDEFGKKHFHLWGDKNQILRSKNLSVSKTGLYYVQMDYANAHHFINTGITACVKQVVLLEGPSSVPVDRGMFVMPHRPQWSLWSDSNLVPFQLEKGKIYHLQISDFQNMSYLQHSAFYTNGSGGESGPVNSAHIAGLKIFFNRINSFIDKSSIVQ